jgi:hypothetical protein
LIGRNTGSNTLWGNPVLALLPNQARKPQLSHAPPRVTTWTASLSASFGIEAAKKTREALDAPHAPLAGRPEN